MDLIKKLEPSQTKTSPNFSTINELNRSQGSQFEKNLSRDTDLEQTPGSGCGIVYKGDLQHSDWLIEAKSTRRGRLVFQAAWWYKARKQANDRQKRFAAILFGWESRPHAYKGSLVFAAADWSLLFPYPAVPDKVLDIAKKSRYIPEEYLDLVSNGGRLAVVLKDKTKLGVTALDNFISIINEHENNSDRGQ